MLHFVKYNLIGVLNTLITLVVVWVLHQQLDWNLEISNFLGFIAGGINSYLVNRIWNFRSTNKKRSEVLRFLVIFVFAYLLNLGTLEVASHLFSSGGSLTSFARIFSPYMKPGYIANIIANIVYVIASFGLYKYWVFKERTSVQN